MMLKVHFVDLVYSPVHTGCKAIWSHCQLNTVMDWQCAPHLLCDEWDRLQLCLQMDGCPQNCILINNYSVIHLTLHIPHMCTISVIDQ